MFLFRNKPVVLDCFTAMPHAHAYAKPAWGSKFFPQWWKDLPLLKHTPDVDNPLPQLNMKGCTGFIDFFRKGLVIPMWSDLDIFVGPSTDPWYKYQYSDLCSSASEHSGAQFKNFVDTDEYQHIKLESPWVFSSNADVSWLASAVPYATSTPDLYTVLPGVVGFDYVPGTNIQLLIKRHPTEMRTLTIKHNTPMVVYHPLSERKIVVKTHLVGAEELRKHAASGTSVVFSRKGMYMRNLIRAKPVQVLQCPFRED